MSHDTTAPAHIATVFRTVHVNLFTLIVWFENYRWRKELVVLHVGTESSTMILLFDRA